MSSDNQFTALGPASQGFFTDGANIDDGVNVQGRRCGVYAESISQDGNRTPPQERTGVCGIGDHYGLYGKADTNAGVYGQSTGDGDGIFGEAERVASTGVVGMNTTVKPRPNRGLASGITGASYNEQGIGVLGVSVNTKLHPPDQAPRRFTSLTQADGNGVGVLGASGTRPGVYGLSDSGPGGEFESRQSAQINLKPLFQTATPPFSGKAGDLLVITQMREDNPTDGFAELWFCIREDANNESAIWGKVQFSETFQR